LLLFTQAKSNVLRLTKNGLGYILGDFLQPFLVTLVANVSMSCCFLNDETLIKFVEMGNSKLHPFLNTVRSSIKEAFL
jgi:hypothetical protein